MSIVLDKHPAVIPSANGILENVLVVDEEITLTETAEMTSLIPLLGIGRIARLPTLQVVRNDPVIVLVGNIADVAACRREVTDVKEKMHVRAAIEQQLDLLLLFYPNLVTMEKT